MHDNESTCTNHMNSSMNISLEQYSCLDIYVIGVLVELN